MDEVILTILTEVRNDLKDYGNKTAAHEVKLKDVLGNGQKGRLKSVEEEIDELKKLKWKAIGMVTALVFLIELLHTLLEGGFKILH